jgi:uncharacterized protein YyaL (SSP411 family)
MNANQKFTNDLIHETSPYLLQHAHNPVHWKAWSNNIFKLATEQNKPILLSIGYAACHWCHVMERESFESNEVAEYMNAHFVNVKVDREERPDVDHLYMEALQAMTGSGGWPLNIFLLPNGKPFYGGTYFPPKTLQNRASWMDVLKGVHEAFENNYSKIEEQALYLSNHLIKTNIISNAENTDLKDIAIGTKEEIDLIAKRIMLNADKQWGGFGNAPKFPQTFALQMLMRHFFIFHDTDSLAHVTFTLDKMIQGGIYDHLGGGFSRYSTDSQWQAPHFEKMLYDNALLISVLSEAYQITKKESYKIVIEQTIDFLFKELSNGNGIFYAALDADSEGVEGKFYTWDYDTLKSIIPEHDFENFCQYYQIKKEGNWEHTNILWTQFDFIDSEKAAIKDIKNLLLSERNKRIRPSTDHKIILSWNCLMISALCKAALALGNKSLIDKAVETMNWIELNMYNEKENYFYHVQTSGVNNSYAFLDDYACLIQAYIHLQEVTGNIHYVYEAKKWTEYVQLHFIDEEKVFFYFTPSYQIDLVIRKKENYDGAQPSGNALMSFNLLYLANMFNLPNWTIQSNKMIHVMRKMILQYPSSFSIWAQSFTITSMGFTELVSIGPNAKNEILPLFSNFLPFKMILFSDVLDDNICLTIGKKYNDNQYFICKNGVCLAPFSNLKDFLTKINQLNY